MKVLVENTFQFLLDPLRRGKPLQPHRTYGSVPLLHKLLLRHL